jgi:hypothetical protein
MVASGVAAGAGLAVAPVAQASGGSPGLPHYVTNVLVSSKTRPSAYLGEAVAISGRTVVVDAEGTPVGGHTNAGAVYVYTRSRSGKGRLTQRSVISAPGEQNDDDVGPVAVSGDTIVIGNLYATVGAVSEAGAAYVFEKPASGWMSTSHPTATLTLAGATDGAHFGDSVAIAGNTIVVGAPQQTVGANAEQGAVLVFTKPTHGWADSSTPAELTSSSGLAGDDLGGSVAVSGSTVVAGARAAEVGSKSDAGMADVFVKPHTGGWETGTETREIDLTAAVADQQFGSEVAISGRQIAIAAAGDENLADLVHAAVFEINEPAAGWGAGSDPPLHPTVRLAPAHSGPYDEFGLSVAISGSMIVAGAPNASFDRKYSSGAVYLFDKPKKGWHNARPSTEFTAANTERWDDFGYSVALSGSTIVAGAPSADYTGVHGSSDRGTAYVFTKSAAKQHRAKTEAAK